jgi:hypothetical protein
MQNTKIHAIRAVLGHRRAPFSIAVFIPRRLFPYCLRAYWMCSLYSSERPFVNSLRALLRAPIATRPFAIYSSISPTWGMILLHTELGRGPVIFAATSSQKYRKYRPACSSKNRGPDDISNIAGCRKSSVDPLGSIGMIDRDFGFAFC